jgi:heme A synthase
MPIGGILMKDLYKYGIGFWIGGGVYSLINMIMNLKNAPQSNILFYNYLITGVAVFGLILNIILLKRKKRTKMNNAIKILLSLLIGMVAMGIATLIHPSWNITHLLIFGLMVFAVTFVLSLLLKKSKPQKNK